MTGKEAEKQDDAAAQLRRVGDLEIEQHLDLQERLWRFQRIGWGIMALLVLAALSGLTGSGPLSRAWAGSPGDLLRVRYDRFLRAESLSALEVHLGPSGRETRIWFSRDYLEAVPFERAVPEPERVEMGPDRVTYVFRQAAAGGTGRITFYGPVTTVGRVEGRVGLPGGPEVRFGQFVYP